jgi:hypothetical protein
MANNYLEDLVAEWYQFQGYFVQRNVRVGRRATGGYECELDVVAFHPGKKHLVHVEPTMDGGSWERRELRYATDHAHWVRQKLKGTDLRGRSRQDDWGASSRDLRQLAIAQSRH